MFYGLPRAGGWVPIIPMGDLDALIVGCPGGVDVKIPFDKRPKTRVQVDRLLMLYVGVRFPSSFFRFGSAGVVVCVELGLGVE